MSSRRRRQQVAAPAPLTEEEKLAFDAWSLDAYKVVNQHCRGEEILGKYSSQKQQFRHPCVNEGMDLDEVGETLALLMKNGYEKLRASGGLEKVMFTVWRTSTLEKLGGCWLSFSKNCPLKGSRVLYVLPHALRHNMKGIEMGDLSRWENESEVLFPPEASFKTKGCYRRGDGDVSIIGIPMPGLKRLVATTQCLPFDTFLREIGPPGWEMSDHSSIDTVILLEEDFN